MFQKDFDCASCTKQIKAFRGCDKDVEPYVICEEELTRCPLKYVTADIWLYIRAHNHYQQGCFPNMGTWLDQPAKFSELMNCIDRIMHKMRVEQANARR